MYQQILDDMTWSFSRLHCFETCPYEWYLTYIETDKDGNPLQPKEQNFYAAYGSFCHRILEQIFKQKLTLSDALQLYINDFDYEVTEDVRAATREKYFDAGLSYFAELSPDWLSAYEVIGVEKECRFRIAGRKFLGFIDLTLREKATGHLICLDHKSAEWPLNQNGSVKKTKQKSYDSYKIQSYLYSKPIYEEYGRYPKELRWNYFRENRCLALPFVEKEYTEALTWAENTIQTIYKEQAFPPHLNYFYCCQLCGFRRSCPYKQDEWG